MKKIILITFFAFQALIIFAKSPEVPLYNAFDGRYNKEKGVTISEITQPNNYYYSIQVYENPKIISQLLSWADSSEKLANSINKSISSGFYNIVYQIPFDDTEINVGLRYPDDKSYINVFLQSDKPFILKK